MAHRVIGPAQNGHSLASLAAVMLALSLWPDLEGAVGRNTQSWQLPLPQPVSHWPCLPPELLPERLGQLAVARRLLCPWKEPEELGPGT